MTRDRAVAGRMQIVADPADLPAFPVLAVIINCGTKWVSSLALASTLRHARYPTLLIDCESHDGSREHFRTLASEQRWVFHWLDWPLQAHGAALDALFKAVNAESILLVDSDVEILDAKPVCSMAERLAKDRSAYGAGFLQKGQWLGAEHGLPAGVGWHEERMWIPLVHLVVDPGRAALAAGESFLQQRRFLEIPEHPVISRMIGLRFFLPGLRARGRFAPTAVDTGAVATAPAFVEYDTGASMHRRLRSSGHRFLAIDEALWSLVEHQHGVTRTHLESKLRRLLRILRIRRTRNAASGEAATRRARMRLATQDGITSAR